MYFWNIKKLKAQLIERPLTEREALPYVIAASLMYLLAFEILTYSYSAVSNEAVPYGILDYISLAFTIAINILGTIWIFKKNKVNSENYFLQRYTALGWVVLIRIMVFFILAMILLFVTLLLSGIYGALDWELYGSLFESSSTVLISNVLFYLFYFWYFGKQVTEVAEKANYQ